MEVYARLNAGLVGNPELIGDAGRDIVQATGEVCFVLMGWLVLELDLSKRESRGTVRDCLDEEACWK